jgi:hypothetical protein
LCNVARGFKGICHFWIDSSVSRSRCKRRLLQLGLEREFDGSGVAVELFQVVEFPLWGEKYMDDNITCKSAKAKEQLNRLRKN